MTPQQKDFLHRAWQAAVKADPSGPSWRPEMAACEAALESGYGHSQLAAQDNNLFGLKQCKHPVYGTVSLPTREFLNGEWEEVEANFVRYDSWQECFADRLANLVRLAKIYPHYKAALNAVNGEEYVRQVSLTWSTDPGWLCGACGRMFLTLAEAMAHTNANPGHPTTEDPGIGRAEKVLAIYDAIAGDWSATETNSP